jgi:hypothetical protein
VFKSLRHPDLELRAISLKYDFHAMSWDARDRQLLKDGSVIIKEIVIGRDTKAATIKSVVTHKFNGKEREMRLIAGLISTFSVHGDGYGSGGSYNVIHATRRGSVLGSIYSNINRPQYEPVPGPENSPEDQTGIPYFENRILQDALDALDHNLMIPSIDDVQGLNKERQRPKDHGFSQFLRTERVHSAPVYNCA